MKLRPTKPLDEVCVAKLGNLKIIKGTLTTANGTSLYPAYTATGRDVFSTVFDFDGDGVVISAVGARCGKCFIAKGKGDAAQPSVKVGGSLKKQVTVPPLPLQQEFARRVTEIRVLEAAQASGRLDALFQSLLHRAFNGEL